MTEQEHLFWNRILELSKMQLKSAAFEYFILDSKLIQVRDKAATILVPKMKQNFWQTNIQPILLTAGFEIYNDEITISYLDDDDITSEEFYSPISTTQATVEETYHTPQVSNLNPRYRFDNFIKGKGSEWAFAAALAVAGSPGTVYNPLFIWGGPGLGKTHLLNAIGNQVLADNPRAKIKYITTEDFVNEFVNHIKLSSMEELKNQFRNLDVLLIDDIQSLAKKTGTQEEFFNTFNVLHANNKQIVLTSDRAPDQLNDLEERLVTRFGWGLTQDITPPDYETRVAILLDKIQDYHFDFPNEAIEYLAGQFDSNVRELEGALKNISLIANAKGVTTITVELIAEALRAIKPDQIKKTVIAIADIQEQVSQFYGLTVKDIKGTKRQQNIVLARQIAMYLTRVMTDFSLPKIGKEFGGRDHSTVLHSYNKIKAMLEEDNNLRLEIDSIKQQLN